MDKKEALKKVKKLFAHERKLLKDRIDYLNEESRVYRNREDNLMTAYKILSQQLKFANSENEKLKNDYRDAMLKLGFTVNK